MKPSTKIKLDELVEALKEKGVTIKKLPTPHQLKEFCKDINSTLHPETIQKYRTYVVDELTKLWNPQEPTEKKLTKIVSFYDDGSESIMYSIPQSEATTQEPEVDLDPAFFDYTGIKIGIATIKLGNYKGCNVLDMSSIIKYFGSRKSFLNYMKFQNSDFAILRLRNPNSETKLRDRKFIEKLIEFHSRSWSN